MKLAAYARVSSDKQDAQLSISVQFKALQEYARRNNHLIVREFVDEAKTGRTSARPAFRQMISAARSSPKPFDAVIVYKFSRFARIRNDSILYKTMLKKKGIRVISVTEPSGDSASERLMEALIESLDEFYSENLGEDVTQRNEGERIARLLSLEQAAVRLPQGQGQ